jgi:hypothetical protein
MFASLRLKSNFWQLQQLSKAVYASNRNVCNEQSTPTESKDFNVGALYSLPTAVFHMAH